MIGRLTIALFGKTVFETLVEHYPEDEPSKDEPEEATRVLGEAQTELSEAEGDNALRFGFRPIPEEEEE